MLHDLRDARAADSGGKAAALGALLRAGIDVPPGVVVPVQGYRRHLTRHQLRPGALPTEELREGILQGRLDAELVAALESTLRSWPIGPRGPQLAVRSSATNEDAVGASAAGQHESILAVQGRAATGAAIRRCWASLWTSHAVDYRQADTSGDAAPPEMAVILQHFVEADVSGVLFTGEERTLEAVRGRGEPLVGGTVTPDSWRICEQGILERRLGGTAHQALCLSDAQVRELVTLGDEIDSVLGAAADIEWALLGDRIHVLQARPITAAVPNSRSPRRIPQESGALQGAPASGGVATGTARIVRGPKDFRRVRPGDVLICHATDPAWTPLFRVAAAVVTETGGVLSHAAIVARELGIPAVLAVPAAVTEIADGSRVTVDGDTGILRIVAEPV